LLASNASTDKIIAGLTIHDKTFLLVVATCREDRQLVDKLLSAGADPRVAVGTPAEKLSAIMIAAKNKNKELVLQFCEHLQNLQKPSLTPQFNSSASVSASTSRAVSSPLPSTNTKEQQVESKDQASSRSYVAKSI